MHVHHVSHAATCLAAIARIPSLADGVVTFAAEDLAGGRWWASEEDVERGPAVVWCPVPPFANERELLESCRRAIELGLEENARLRRWLDDERRRRGLE